MSSNKVCVPVALLRSCETGECRTIALCLVEHVCLTLWQVELELVFSDGITAVSGD